jgi:hypothetical protein
LEKRDKTFEKGIEKHIERKQESLVQKGKGTKRPLERKEETPVKHFRDEVAQRNLQVLVEAVIEDDKPTTKESTTTQKKLVNARKKKSVVPIEGPLSTRKSVRLSVKMTK